MRDIEISRAVARELVDVLLDRAAEAVSDLEPATIEFLNTLAETLDQAQGAAGDDGRETVGIVIVGAPL